VILADAFALIPVALIILCGGGAIWLAIRRALPNRKAPK
jgi:hypothetical protein